MIDSLGEELSEKDQVKIQKDYNVDIYITTDEFQDKDITTKKTIDYLKELIEKEIFEKEIMVIIQGKSVNDYIDHFNDLLIITTNAETCINCENNSKCEAIFKQTIPGTIKSGITYSQYHSRLYVPSKEKKSWVFRFGIGGLIGRRVEEQKKIIESVVNYGIKSSIFSFKDIFPRRFRTIMIDTTSGQLKKIEHNPIQFHILGVGASNQIFPTIIKNQPYILSFDASTPSLMGSKIYQIFDKELKRISTEPAFRQASDDVGDVSALNTLRNYYNTAMILYAMESQLKTVKENETINMLKRFIKYRPKASKIKQVELKKFLESEKEIKAERILFGKIYIEKKKRGLTDKEIIEEALIRWTKLYEKENIMTISLALLHGLILFGSLNIKEIIANIPLIKSPSAAMNKITVGYEIMDYPICEDTFEYKAYKILSSESKEYQNKVYKTIKIRDECLDLVLQYLLKSKKLIAAYKRKMKTY
jgi:hypothetical protein